MLSKKFQNEMLLLTESFFCCEMQFYMNFCHLQIETKYFILE